MGDVYNAMARARLERENRADPLDAGLSPPTEVEDPAAPVVTASDIPMRSRGSARPASALTSASPATGREMNTPPEAGRNGYAESIVVHHDRGSIIAEQYRRIRGQILDRRESRCLQSHVITSALPGEGRSVTTVNLGVCFAELKNTKVLVVEGDLLHPSFDALFARPCPVGLSQYLCGQIDDVDEVLYPTIYDNLQFLPAGPGEATESAKLLSRPRLVQMLNRVKNRFDHIFIDTSPVMTMDDAKILGAIGDQTLLVVRLHKTAIELIERTKRILRAANCDLAGLVMTHADGG